MQSLFISLLVDEVAMNVDAARGDGFEVVDAA